MYIIKMIILKSRAALVASQIGNVLPSLKSFSWTLNFPDDLFTNPLAIHKSGEIRFDDLIKKQNKTKQSKKTKKTKAKKNQVAEY